MMVDHHSFHCINLRFQKLFIAHTRGLMLMTLMYLCLNHSWPLGPQGPDCLEDIHHPLVLHPLQHNTQRDEHACPPNASAIKKYIIFKRFFSSQSVENILCLFLNVSSSEKWSDSKDDKILTKNRGTSFVLCWSIYQRE